MYDWWKGSYGQQPRTQLHLLLSLIIPSQQRWRGYSNAAVHGWLGEWMGACVRPLRFTLWARYRLQFFAQSLSYFTCTLLMMRGRTLLILGHKVKGQGQLWHSVYKTLWAQYRLQFYFNHFQTSHVSCGWWEEESYWFWVTGSKVKVIFGTLCIKPCGLDTDYTFTPITFKLHMSFVDDENRNPIKFGSWGQRSRSTLALCVENLVGTIQTTVLLRSLWNFTCRFWMIRGVIFGTLCIKTCGHYTDYSFCPITFKLHMHIVDDKRRNPIYFGSRVQRSRSTLAFCV